MWAVSIVVVVVIHSGTSSRTSWCYSMLFHYMMGDTFLVVVSHSLVLDEWTIIAQKAILFLVVSRDVPTCILVAIICRLIACFIATHLGWCRNVERCIDALIAELLDQLWLLLLFGGGLQALLRRIACVDCHGGLTLDDQFGVRFVAVLVDGVGGFLSRYVISLLEVGLVLLDGRLLHWTGLRQTRRFTLWSQQVRLAGWWLLNVVVHSCLHLWVHRQQVIVFQHGLLDGLRLLWLLLICRCLLLLLLLL